MEEALAAPLHGRAAERRPTDAPYFVDLVRQQLAQRYDPNDLTTQNLSIYTTLDLHLQGARPAGARARASTHVQELIKKRTTEDRAGLR